MGAERVKILIQAAVKGGQEVLSELDAKEILREWGLPVPACKVAGSAKEAAATANDMGYPVVLKVHSPAITHKSDVGGVKLDLADALAVEKAYGEIAGSCSKIDPGFKVLVQPMLKPGIEVILGVSRDAQFGPVILFGLGGIYTELFKDVAFRLIPVEAEEARRMVDSIQSVPLLKGFRGKPGGDMDLLTDMIVKVSSLVAAHPEVAEMDLNPVMVYPQGAAVADARMVIRPS